jgi:hypothetical protein
VGVWDYYYYYYYYYYSKYEYGWHIAPGCTGTDAIAAVRLAIAEAERLAGGIPLAQQLIDPASGTIAGIKLVEANGRRVQGPRVRRVHHLPPGADKKTKTKAQSRVQPDYVSCTQVLGR